MQIVHQHSIVMIKLIQKVQTEFGLSLTNVVIGQPSSTFQVSLTYTSLEDCLVLVFLFSVPYTDSIRELQSQIVKSFDMDTSIQLQFIESLHISLTRTVVLQHHWIDEFTKSVRESVIDLKKYENQFVWNHSRS